MHCLTVVLYWEGEGSKKNWLSVLLVEHDFWKWSGITWNLFMWKAISFDSTIPPFYSKPIQKDRCIHHYNYFRTKCVPHICPNIVFLFLCWVVLHVTCHHSTQVIVICFNQARFNPLSSGLLNNFSYSHVA